MPTLSPATISSTQLNLPVKARVSCQLSPNQDNQDFFVKQTLSNKALPTLSNRNHSAQVSFKGENYIGQDLSGVDLSGDDLKYADFSEANLSNSKLVDADLSCAGLYRTNLSGANLRNVNLSNANLAQANLSGADLRGANLYLAQLSQTNLDGTQFDDHGLHHLLLREDPVESCRVTENSQYKKSLEKFLAHSPKATNLEILEQLILTTIPYWLSNPDDSKLTSHIKLFLSDFQRKAYYRHDKKPFVKLQPELLLLIRHPKLSQDGDALADILNALYWPFNLSIQHQREVQHVNNLGKKGLVTHDFKRYRFDTMSTNGPKSSLFEQYGALLLPASKTSASDFGKRFLFNRKLCPSLKLDPETNIILARGFMLVTNALVPGHLVIRNSSKVFGRNLMDYASLFAETPIPEKKLVEYDPRTVAETDLPSGLASFHSEKTHFLLVELFKLRDDYAKWKFDIDATDDQGNSEAYLSPGFDQILDFLDRYCLEMQMRTLTQPSKVQPIPSLAFINPDYPIYKPYSVYPMTKDHIEEVKRYRMGEMTTQEMKDSEFIQFLQSGLNQERAELVLIQGESK